MAASTQTPSERPTLVLGRRSPTIAPEDDETEIGTGDEVGSWRLDAHLADGGMSAVYAAHHRFLERRAAIKIALGRSDDAGSTRERFLREAQLLARLDHRGVAEMYDVGVLPDGRPWMAMELLEGRTLAQIADAERIEPLRALAWLRQVAQTLSAAHSIGVIHRDVKPDNVFVGVDGRVRLLDWGIAFHQTAARDPRFTQGRLLIGTPTYIAPEQVRGLEVDGHADVYSLGVMAYELFTHRLPFEGLSDVDVAAQHVLAEPPPLHETWAEAPPRLESLILCMLAKDPDRRPDIDDVDRELAAIAPLLR
jgi:serine/threonine-protein kinase